MQQQPLRPGLRVLDVACGTGNLAVLAAKQGCMECVTLLLRMGADPGLRGKHGQTALEMALSEGNTDIGELLERAMKMRKQNRAIE